MKDIVTSDVPEKIYISPVGCHGILRRKQERKISMNHRLEQVLLENCSNCSKEEIEKKSKVQKRGKFSTIKKHINTDKLNSVNKTVQISMFD